MMREQEATPTRRAIARGVVWATPTIAAAVAAPALAVSACRPTELQAFPSSGTSGNGWTISSTGGTTSGSTRFGTSTYSSQSLFTDAAAAPGATYTATTTAGAVLVAGRQYRLRFTYNVRTSNALLFTGEARVGTTTVPGTSISTADRTGSNTRIGVDTTFTMPSPAPTTLSFFFRSQNTGTGSASADEFRIYDVVLECL